MLRDQEEASEGNCGETSRPAVGEGTTGEKRHEDTEARVWNNIVFTLTVCKKVEKSDAEICKMFVSSCHLTLAETSCKIHK